MKGTINTSKAAGAAPDRVNLAAAATAGTAGDALRLLREQSLTTLVQREIERQIVAGDLAAGAKLSEIDFCNELGVSRGPVREAFRMLEQAGLVRTEKNRGVFVRQVSIEEANDIYEVRAVLDGLIGRLAASRITPAQLARLKAVVKRMRAAERTLDADEYFPLNLEFHEVLAEATGNTALIANYRRVVNELNLYRREMLLRDGDNITRSTREHEAIVEAVAKGQADTAERLLFDHVIHSRERLHRALAMPAPRARKAPRKVA
jgi:phosphonate utilization transcriptional regulator